MKREKDIFKDFYRSPIKNTSFQERNGTGKGVKLEVTRKITTVKRVPFVSIASPYDPKSRKHET